MFRFKKKIFTLFLKHSKLKDRFIAEIAQSVEQWTENPRVDGSIPPLGNLFSYSGDGLGCRSLFSVPP